MKEKYGSMKKKEILSKESQQGISLISLVIAITLILLIAGILLYNARNYTQIAKLENLHNDIQLLEEQIEIFYSKHGSLPTLSATYNMNDIDNKNPNDAGNYNVINLDVLASIRLNYGKEFSNVKQKVDNESEYRKYTDVYVVNEISHTVYYVKGIKVDNNIYYRDNKQYSKVGTKLVDMFIAGESCNAVDCEDPKHLHVGDYVSYTPYSGKTSVTVGTDKTGYTGVKKIEGGKTDQTYTLDTTTTWRVLGLSEDREHVLLISGSPLKNDGEYPYLILERAASYCYCENTLDEICSLYHNPNLADSTRSIRVEDINHAVGVVVDEANKKIYKKDDPSQTNIGFVAEGSYQYKIGDYAPENYLGIGEKTSKDSVPGLNDKLYYAYGSNNLGLDTSSKIYEVLFDGTTDEEKNAKGYWLASPGVAPDPSLAIFGAGFVGDGGVARGSYTPFSSSGYWQANSLGVRPVVSLKTNITDSQVSKRSDISKEPIWSYDNRALEVNDGTYTGGQGKITK